MKVANVNTTPDGKIADYEGEVLRKPSWRSVTRRGKVEGHRRHDLVIWALIRKMLQNMGY